MKTVCWILVYIYTMFNLLGFLFGVINPIVIGESCNDKWRRIEYVLPAYRVGCWLAEIPGE